ncbi:MAG TPA: hypothetical protein VFS20_26410 [Longimicrobium sp.]|nr:hypothetical protein [Longimicrobium sp.]
MSLLGFQRAMSDLAASPDLVRAVRADAQSALAGYELTPLEHRRVASAAAQRGMVINCRLHRSNRSSSILSLLRGTVFVLEKEMRGILDRFWADHPTPDFTTRREIRRFAGWLLDEVKAGRIESPYLAEIVGWDLAQYELMMMARRRTLARVAEDAERFPDGPLALHPLVRVAAFEHDPPTILQRAANRVPLPWTDLPTGEFYVLLDNREGWEVSSLDLETGRVLYAIQQGAPVPDDERDELLELELVVRTAPADASDTSAEVPAEPALAGAA